MGVTLNLYFAPQSLGVGITPLAAEHHFPLATGKIVVYKRS
jgi:hypothetical protein